MEFINNYLDDIKNLDNATNEDHVTNEDHMKNLDDTKNVNDANNLEVPIQIPTLDTLLSQVHPTHENDNPKNLSFSEKEEIMKNIEQTANFTSASEGLDALNNPTIIFTRLQNAFDTFKEKTGRNMTYSEMRYMMG
jgi:hypothetical protein